MRAKLNCLWKTSTNEKSPGLPRFSPPPLRSPPPTSLGATDASSPNGTSECSLSGFDRLLRRSYFSRGSELRLRRFNDAWSSRPTRLSLSYVTMYSPRLTDFPLRFRSRHTSQTRYPSISAMQRISPPVTLPSSCEAVEG